MDLPRARAVLATAAIVFASVVAAGCGAERSADGARSPGIEFGIWTPDARGGFIFEATREVPYVEEQAFGWLVEGAGPDEPVKWVERLELPSPPPSWEGVADSPNVALSDDGRVATTFGTSMPGDDFVGNVWYVSRGDPQGDCRISIEFADGRKATFRFRIVPPTDGRAPAGPGEII